MPSITRSGTFSPILLCKNVDIKIHNTIILSFVSCGCETWSLTLREEQRLRVFYSRVLREAFWTERDEETGERRKLHMRIFVVFTLH
jgi:hypothetical protein